MKEKTGSYSDSSISDERSTFSPHYNECSDEDYWARIQVEEDAKNQILLDLYEEQQEAFRTYAEAEEESARVLIEILDKKEIDDSR